MNIKERNSL